MNKRIGGACKKIANISWHRLQGKKFGRDVNGNRKKFKSEGNKEMFR